MAASNTFLETDDIDPIDVTEAIAEHHNWDFDRLTENQIALAITGQWRTYSVTIAWSPSDETLRMVVTFEMQPPEEQVVRLYALLNLINHECWAGAFTFWEGQQLMVYRYGLLLTGDQQASGEQIETMVNAAIFNCERYYPAFQLLVWGNRTPEEAVKAAIAEAYGRA